MELKRIFPTFPFQGVSAIPLNLIPDLSPVHIGLPPTIIAIKQRRINVEDEEIVLRGEVEYKAVCSNKSRFVLRCVSDNCSWGMRATKVSCLDFSYCCRFVPI
ncbi:hypothetical protein YC2023_045590 [Brassica napus]